MANAGSFRKGEKRPNQGKHGSPKVTAELKDMIRQSLEEAGGVDYLRERALDPKTAAAFLSLLGKVLPMTVSAPDGGPVQVVAVHLVPMIASKRD